MDKDFQRRCNPGVLENVNGFFTKSQQTSHLQTSPFQCVEAHRGVICSLPLKFNLLHTLRGLASQQMGGGLWSVEAILCMAAVACPGVMSPAAGRAVPWPSQWAGIQLAGKLNHALTHTMHTCEHIGGEKSKAERKVLVRGGILRAEKEHAVLNKVNCGWLGQILVPNW